MGGGSYDKSDFLLQRIWKANFFIKNPNLTKKNLAGGRGVARVSDLFFFSKESKYE